MMDLDILDGDDIHLGNHDPGPCFLHVRFMFPRGRCDIYLSNVHSALVTQLLYPTA